MAIVSCATTVTDRSAIMAIALTAAYGLPITHRRANRLIAKGRALRHFDRGLFYIKLLDRSDGYTQPVALGI
jgi:hypothetical protein